MSSISLAGDLNHLPPHTDFSYVILFFYSLIWFTDVRKWTGAFLLPMVIIFPIIIASHCFHWDLPLVWGYHFVRNGGSQFLPNIKMDSQLWKCVAVLCHIFIQWSVQVFQKWVLEADVATQNKFLILNAGYNYNNKYFWLYADWNANINIHWLYTVVRAT